MTSRKKIRMYIQTMHKQIRVVNVAHIYGSYPPDDIVYILPEQVA